MQIASDLWVAALYGGILVLAAIGQCITRNKALPMPAPTILPAGSDQMERLIRAVEGIPAAIHDKRRDASEVKLETLLDVLKGVPLPRQIE